MSESVVPPAAVSEEPRADGLPQVSPDFVEQDFPETIDNIIPTRGYDMLPLVGLGGSAGSIEALKHFFERMPPESGMAFVVIVHLSPEHESILAELLGRTTTMPVLQALDLQKVEANTVYVIPPGKHLTLTDGHLKLTPLEPDRGRRVVVDLFFRTLADTHGPHAAAIILSGADGDGALGIKRIKERGGLTIAQDPDEAEHSSHAAHGDRYRHGRLGAAGAGDAGAAAGVSRQRAAAEAPAGGGAAAGQGAAHHGGRPMKRRCARCSPTSVRAPAAIFRITSGPRSCGAFRAGCR